MTFEDIYLRGSFGEKPQEPTMSRALRHHAYSSTHPSFPHDLGTLLQGIRDRDLAREVAGQSFTNGDSTRVDATLAVLQRIRTVAHNGGEVAFRPDVDPFADKQRNRLRFIRHLYENRVIEP